MLKQKRKKLDETAAGKSMATFIRERWAHLILQKEQPGVAKFVCFIEDNEMSNAEIFSWKQRLIVEDGDTEYERYFNNFPRQCSRAGYRLAVLCYVYVTRHVNWNGAPLNINTYKVLISLTCVFL